jgi:peroxiredoxin Q/BCP
MCGQKLALSKVIVAEYFLERLKMAKAKKKVASKKATGTKEKSYKGLKLGEKLPSFKLSGTSGQEISNKDFEGYVTVLYFYPKDNTPGCTMEGHDFRLRMAQFKKQGAQILGVSRDSISSHEKFKEKCGFPFELISDPDDKLGKIFDVIQLKKLYGREFIGVERSTFVIDKNGKLAGEWRKVKVAGHADEVLEFVKNL